MTPITEIIFSGFVSKVVNDIVDVSKDKIKKAVKSKNTKYQSVESQIYNVIVDVLNKITGNRYKNEQDNIYDVAEALFKSLKENGRDELGYIKSCLQVLGLNADQDGCLRFKVSLYEELGKNEYGELFRAILLLQLENKNQYDHVIYEQLNQKLDEVILILDGKDGDNKKDNKKRIVKSRTLEYANKWNANMFLNDFDKRDENAGVNVKLSEVYLDEHLPNYLWGKNKNESSDIKDLLKEYVSVHSENKMLLILGQPGIGKSTLITWVTANFRDRNDDILVYQFASDLKNIDWENSRISNRILEKLHLDYNDLNGKVLILDGFDEASIGNSKRRNILDCLYGDLIYEKNVENFTLIITCRENYINGFERVKCNYITLKSWNEIQIKSFCNVFEKKTKNGVSKGTIDRLIKNKDILGIPLILYMILALNISIEKEVSIVDIYDKIFSLEGGIYDRCIDNKKFAESHRISDIKAQIHQISREIAVWMFENEPDKTSIPQEEYQIICNNIIQDQKKNKEIEQDFLIGNFFKSVKHCEGMETEELYFVHRTIYEYFVAETIYNSIENALIDLSEKGEEELAGNIAVYLKQGELSYTIGEYLYYKIKKSYNRLNSKEKEEFYLWFEKAVGKMMDLGMFYYTKRNICNYSNILTKQVRCFLNLMSILRWLLRLSSKHYILESANQKQVIRHISYYITEYKLGYISNGSICNLKKVYLKEANLIKFNLERINLRESCLEEADLRGASLKWANLMEANLTKTDFYGADLRGVKLIRACLSEANLSQADLRESNLVEANLYKADLRGTKLEGADLRKANIEESIWREEDIQKNLQQLKIADFTCIIIETQITQRRTERVELF